MMPRLVRDVAEVLICFLDSNNMCCSDVVLQRLDAVLSYPNCWMMCNVHEDNDDVRCVATEENSP